MKAYKTGILFVHGIQGSPGQFSFLTDQLPPSVPVRNILLPGHGATTAEFRKATAEQWMDAVRKASASLEQTCEHILFVGHSMGCLLGLLTEQERKVFAGMLLLCCPFRIHPTFRHLRGSLSAAGKKTPTSDPFILAAREANSVSAEHAVSYLFCGRPYAELLRLIQRTKKQTLSIPDKTVFCFSEKDEIVSRKSIPYVKDHLHNDPVILSGCGHDYYTPAGQSLISRILLCMINGLNEKNPLPR